MLTKNFLLTDTALAISGDVTPEDWMSLSSHLVANQRSIAWWLGDLLNLGEQMLGEEFYQYIDQTAPLDLIQSYAFVCRQFQRSERIASLSFTHHKSVIGLPKAVQTAMLARAEMENWDSQTMRDKVRELKDGTCTELGQPDC